MILTLVSVCAGGPIYGGGNNFPLRGGKYSEFEGGVRVAAFASGGYIPMNSRGTVATGIGAVADIYTTFCAMAGVNATDVMGNAAGLPPVDGLDISPLLLGTGPSPRTEIIVEPLDPKDQAALDVFDGLLDTTSVSPPFDVHKGFACGADNGYKIQFLPNTTLAGCEAACAALPSCQMFSHKDDSTPEPSHFCSLYNATARPLANPKFDCGCRGMCPEKPPPPPPGPPGPPAPPKPGKCAKLQGWDYTDPNISVVQNVELNDCCGICNRTVGCAVSVWSTYDNGPKSNGSCVTKSSRNSPRVLSFHGASFLPSGAPIPAPVIQDQAGLIVGDMKLVVGTAVNMAVFTGPHFPNASTPWTNNATIKVPSFACSAPGKAGCLFNVSADPTEHNDLALAMPDTVAQMLTRLRELSRSRFDPARGGGDKRACAQMIKNQDSRGKGYFGPWLP